MKLSPVTSASSTGFAVPPTTSSSVWWNCNTDSEISVQDYTRYRGLPSYLVLHPQRTTSQGAVRCEQCLYGTPNLPKLALYSLHTSHGPGKTVCEVQVAFRFYPGFETTVCEVQVAFSIYPKAIGSSRRLQVKPACNQKPAFSNSSRRYNVKPTCNQKPALPTQGGVTSQAGFTEEVGFSNSSRHYKSTRPPRTACTVAAWCCSSKCASWMFPGLLRVLRWLGMEQVFRSHVIVSASGGTPGERCK